MPCRGGGVRTVRDGAQPCEKSGSAARVGGPLGTLADDPSRTIPAHSCCHRSLGESVRDRYPARSTPDRLAGLVRSSARASADDERLCGVHRSQVTRIAAPPWTAAWKPYVAGVPESHA